MSSLVLEIKTEPRAKQASVSDEALEVDLTDGRTIIVPLAWYPRLWYGTKEERNHCMIIGDGAYLHWPELDEDLTVSGILAGYPSRESQKSLKKWLAARELAAHAA
jgi:hypothetical protein